MKSIKTSKLRAFTLIELLIVVAIIGILAAIAVPNFLNAQTKAKLAQTTANFKAIGTAMMSYRLDNNSFALHDPSHAQNVLNNALTTPISYIASMPIDLFQNTQMTAADQRLSGSGKGNPELHPEPLYGNSYGNLSMDGDPAKYENLTYRFKDSLPLFEKAKGTFPDGRYIVSIGPDLQHTYPGTYDISNGLNSRGDIIWVIP